MFQRQLISDFVSKISIMYSLSAASFFPALFFYRLGHFSPMNLSLFSLCVILRLSLVIVIHYSIVSFFFNHIWTTLRYLAVYTFHSPYLHLQG